VLTAADIIRLLDLKPHPEGGHFRETFRDDLVLTLRATPPPHPPPQAGEGREGERGRVGEGARAASTAIYFLLARGERSHWHRIDAAEVWHFYAGAPLALEIAANEHGPITRVLLGTDLAHGERPQAVVPARAWQAAASLGDWTLAGCTVAPGFEFTAFELAPKGWVPRR
jgi:predicted cupin superfamily sugar epimerase